MSIPTQNRRPAGSPAGGQFAPTSHAESDLDLAADTAPQTATARRHIHLTTDIRIPDGTRDRLHVVLDGVERMGAGSGVEFEVTAVSGTASGVGARVVDLGTDEAYSLEVTDQYLHVSAEDGPVFTDMVMLRPFTSEEVSKHLADSLRNIATTRQCQVALDRLATDLTLPERVTLDTTQPGAPQFSRGDDHLQVEATDQATYVTTRSTHPVTGAVMEDRFEVTGKVGADGQLRTVAEIEWGGPAQQSPDDPTPRLSAWVDGFTGRQRFLDSAAAEQMLAVARYARQDDEPDERSWEDRLLGR